MGQITCPNCGTVAVQNESVCAKCGTLLFDPKSSTVHMRVDPYLLRLRRNKELRKTGSLVMSSERLIGLQIRGIVEKLAFEEGTEIVLGRIDLANKITEPRFDLTPYGGHERGVSREHAVLRYDGTVLTVTDLKSVNGTMHNQKRIEPNVATQLNDRDELTLGNLTIVIRFLTEDERIESR
jgi:hypothetical protein